VSGNAMFVVKAETNLIVVVTIGEEGKLVVTFT
jgi:hypothetical protein